MNVRFYSALFNTRECEQHFFNERRIQQHPASIIDSDICRYNTCTIESI